MDWIQCYLVEDRRIKPSILITARHIYPKLTYFLQNGIQLSFTVIFMYLIHYVISFFTCLVLLVKLFILSLLFMRQGWSYVGDRLLSAVIPYEESGWYDGQMWVKPPEVQNVIIIFFFFFLFFFSMCDGGVGFWFFVMKYIKANKRNYTMKYIKANKRDYTSDYTVH